MKKNAGLRRICISAMLMALSVVIGIVCKNFLTWSVYYRITFENFPIIMAGFCFGPVYGLAVGAGADIVSCLCSVNPAVNPIITAGAACVGLLSGLVPVLMRRSRPSVQLALSVALSHLFGQVIIKSVGKIVFFGMPAIGILIGFAVSCIVGTAEFFFLRILFRNRAVTSTLRGLTDHELY